MAALKLVFPFTGRWLVQNSPADRVPSHGTTAFASSWAIDFVPVGENGRTAPVRWRTWLQPEPPTAFPGFGRPLLAPVDGVVIGVLDSMLDHDAHRGLPSVGYALSQGRRADRGWPALAGNHVMIQTAGGPVVALCHLRQDSARVQVGERLRPPARARVLLRLPRVHLAVAAPVRTDPAGLRSAGTGRNDPAPLRAPRGRQPRRCGDDPRRRHRNAPRGSGRPAAPQCAPRRRDQTPGAEP